MPRTTAFSLSPKLPLLPRSTWTDGPMGADLTQVTDGRGILPSHAKPLQYHAGASFFSGPPVIYIHIYVYKYT